jgi:hypothetical protein
VPSGRTTKSALLVELLVLCIKPFFFMFELFDHEKHLTHPAEMTLAGDFMVQLVPPPPSTST